MARTFETVTAVRQAVPLWIGIVGASGSGKTKSALRLATGMSRVSGDGVFVIDTEARRSAHYSDEYRYQILDFKPPFGPTDYLDAIKHCIGKGAKTIVIDSFSHEWEGEGGVLESHDAECERLAQQWGTSRDKVQMSAWQRPKGEHRRLLSYMLQSGANFILCYRAREKLKVLPGKQPVPLGWQPVGSDDVIYESTANILLYPGSGGTPSWQPNENGEKALVKLPGQFREMFKDRKPLDEATGEALARWAAGALGAASGVSSGTHGMTTASAPSVSAPPPDRASAGSLEALSAQLTANGLATKEERRKWLYDLTGMTAANLTEEACQRAIERAEEGAR